MVSRAVLLDSGPIGLVTNPKRSPTATSCTKWLQALLARKVRVVLPEIADYEVRRELLRARKVKGLAKLDALAELLEYCPSTTEAMRQAAMFWAQARQEGQPTAGDKTIDGREHPGLKRTKGYVGFLGHTGRVEFRNIRIKELPQPTARQR